MENNDVETYSRSFFIDSFSSGPSKRDGKDVQKVLDVLFLLECMKYRNNLLQKPYNILIRYTQSEIILALTSDKALFTKNIIISSNRIFNDKENQEEDIRTSAFRELGLKPQFFIHFKKSDFDGSFDWLLSRFNDKNKLIDRANWLLNNGEEIPNSTRKLIDSINKGLSHSFGKIGNDIMWIDPIFRARDLTINPNEAFCIMQFSPKRKKMFKLLRDHLDDKFKINLVKSGNDTFLFNRTIMESIWTHINTSKFVIADISDKNPNVFYELGICHTLGKPVILICDKHSLESDHEGKYPFDISALPVLNYSDEMGGEDLLFKDVDKMISSIDNNDL